MGDISSLFLSITSKPNKCVKF